MKYLKMKLSAFLVLLLLAGLNLELSAQGMEFFKGTFDEAIAKAAEEDKMVFVDAYATWCGPCKRLSANVFPHQRVGEFYNKHFINLKLDAEKEGKPFAREYGVSAYPTMFYFDKDKNLIRKIKGGRSVDGFLSEGQQAVDKAYLEKMGEEYNGGNRDPEFLRDYAQKLFSTNKPYQGPLGQYLNALSDEQKQTEENLNLIYELTSTSTDPGLSFLLANKKKFEQKIGKSEVQTKLQGIVDVSLDQAVRNKDQKLFDEALTLMQGIGLEDLDLKITTAEMRFYKRVKDQENYTRASLNYAKYIQDQPAELADLAWAFYMTVDDEKQLKTAEGWISKAIKQEPTTGNYNIQAYLLYKMGKNDAAEKAATTAVKIASSAGSQNKGAQALLDRLKSASDSLEN